MEAIKQQLDSMGSYKYFLIGFAVFMVIYYIFMTFYVKKKKSQTAAKVAQWANEHPEVAKVYIEQKKRVGRTDQFKILSIDEEAPKMITEKGKIGFYILPGERVLKLKFITTRPGVAYKTVTKTYGPTKQQVTIEANQNYSIRFDTKTKEYEFKHKDTL